MSKDDSASLYSCWQNLFHFSKKTNQENNKNMKRSEEISVPKSISLDEMTSTTTIISKCSQTDHLENHGIRTSNLKKKVSCKNSLNNDENFKILRQDYAAYSHTNLHSNEKIKSGRFEKGDFGKHFKYPKVYALYKTVSGLRICLRENCKNSSKCRKDNNGKCICPHCGAMAVVTESLKHPVTFDYNVNGNPSNNPHREKSRKKYIQRKCSLLQHPSFVNVVTKLKALENRIAQLEVIVSRNGYQYNVEAEKVQQSRQFAKRFDIPTSELRSEKYRRKQKLEALNNYSEEGKISLPQNSKSLITKPENYIKEANLNENKSKLVQTHSTIQNETNREKSSTNSSKFQNTNSAKKNVPEQSKIETVKTNVDIENKSKFETNRYKPNKSAHIERSTIAESNKPSTYSIPSDSMSCWSNFKSKFLQSDKSNDANKLVQIFKSKRTGSEISSQKSGKNMTGKLRSVTNSDRYSSYNTSYQNMMCQTYNKIPHHNVNRESMNCSPELKPSEIRNTINKVKTLPQTDINYKELLNATAKKPLELNKLATLSHEEKTQLLLEKMQNLEDINKKMNMMQYHYEETK